MIAAARTHRRGVARRARLGFRAERCGAAAHRLARGRRQTPSARAARALGFRDEGLLREGIAGKTGRVDAWIAGLLATEDRTPQPWPVREE
ncbi:hypothetical protein [Microbacterium lacticum]